MFLDFCSCLSFNDFFEFRNRLSMLDAFFSRFVRPRSFPQDLKTRLNQTAETDPD